MKSLQRILAIVVKELRQLSRDRLTFGMIIGIPAIQLLMFGFAINMDVRHLSAAVADYSNSAASRQVVMDMAQTQVIDINYQASGVEELESLMRQGKIVVGIYIPPDYERRLQQPDRSAIQLLIDGSDTVVQGAVTGIARTSRTSPFEDKPPVMEIRTYYNPERRSPVNTVPGLIGVILTMTMMIFTAVAIVRERELGNLELLINTPVSSVELMLGKVVPYIVIGLVQLLVILLAGKLLFDVPVRGSVLDLYLAASLFIAANLALGLFVSTAVKSQFQAMQMTFFLILPSILLSGFVFPFDGMPKFAQYLGEALPITHFIRLTRGIMLREASIGDMPGAMLYLAAFSVVAITAAALRFSKRLD